MSEIHPYRSKSSYECVINLRYLFHLLQESLWNIVYQQHGADTGDSDDQMTVALDTADCTLKAFVRAVDDTDPMALAEVGRIAVGNLVMMAV